MKFIIMKFSSRRLHCLYSDTFYASVELCQRWRTSFPSLVFRGLCRNQHSFAYPASRLFS